MRRGDVNELHEQALQDRMQRVAATDVVVTRLYSHNADVDTINQQHLTALTTPVRRYEMRTSGAAAKREQLAKSVLAPEVLELKRGAEVMFVANNFASGFVNGTRGTVIDFDSDNRPIVVIANGKEIAVEPHSWKLEEDGKVRAEVAQLPLRLAWAITIHKSQGMSLDAAEIDLARTFTPGMGYVALSRVRSMDGVYLQGINRMALAMHPAIFDFDVELRERSESLGNITSDYETPSVDQVQHQAAEDPLLFDELRQWRYDRAQRDGVAPYMVAHDTTLHELATRHPQTKQALLGIKGMGAAKVEKYSEELLAVLKSE